MKDELIIPFLDKNVKITFKNRETRKGLLKVGYVKLDNSWIGEGYHLEAEKYSYGFQRSHIKTIEVIE